MPSSPAMRRPAAACESLEVPDYSLRRADLDDVGALVALSVAIQGLHHQHQPTVFLPADPEASEAGLRKWLGEDGELCWLAERGGRALGYLTAREARQAGDRLVRELRAFHVSQVVVDPEFRGRGVGRALMEAALAHAREEGFETAQLNVWAFNATAAAFFASFGFAPANTRMVVSL